MEVLLGDPRFVVPLIALPCPGDSVIIGWLTVQELLEVNMMGQLRDTARRLNVEALVML